VRAAVAVALAAVALVLGAPAVVCTMDAYAWLWTGAQVSGFDWSGGQPGLAALFLGAGVVPVLVLAGMYEK